MVLNFLPEVIASARSRKEAGARTQRLLWVPEPFNLSLVSVVRPRVPPLPLTPQVQPRLPGFVDPEKVKIWNPKVY